MCKDHSGKYSVLSPIINTKKEFQKFCWRSFLFNSLNSSYVFYYCDAINVIKGIKWVKMLINLLFLSLFTCILLNLQCVQVSDHRRRRITHLYLTIVFLTSCTWILVGYTSIYNTHFYPSPKEGRLAKLIGCLKSHSSFQSPSHSYHFMIIVINNNFLYYSPE